MQKEGDKYVLFKCDGCGSSQCKECGNYTASEEKCFPLSERKVIILCNKCQEETKTPVDIMQKNRSLRRQVETLEDNLISQKNQEEKFKETKDILDEVKKSNEEEQNHITEL
ncbi:hypothetical protein WA026_014108 [Henosepilachna vigintioctopunctata]|uniref:Uncharacterized protein n=1 Tax=Henosepilachna vigintioctopunctata TaxID=420089 RepID=A0AAW1TMW4_9CUCU